MSVKLKQVDCKHGAPMGRNSHVSETTFAGKFRLTRIPINAQGYDSGGAYWGLGDPLFFASADGSTEVQEMWTRATDREDAKRKVKLMFPNARFYR